MIVTTPTTRDRDLGLGEAFLAWVTARVLVFIGFAAADAIASVLKVTDPVATLHVRERLVTWDGHWYWLIAHGGYDAAGHDGLRFFPLYPMLARALAWPMGGRVGLALVLVANVAAYACLVLFRRLVLEEHGDDDLARRAMWLLAIFPAAGAMVFAYGESLMLAASLVGFLAIKRDRWWLVAIAGLVAGLTRPAAVLLVVPFLVEALRPRHRQTPIWWRAAGVLAPAAGASLYLFWVGGEYGDWLAPVSIQRHLRGGFQDPLTRLYDGFRLLGRSQLDAPNLAFAVLFIVLVIISFRTERLSWSLYALATLVVALSAHNIDSIGRYGLVAFPFVAVLARLGDDERFEWAAFALSAGALVGLTAMATLGAYQP